MLLIFSEFKYYNFFLICLSLLSAKRIRNSRNKYKIIKCENNFALTLAFLLDYCIYYFQGTVAIRSACRISRSVIQLARAFPLLLFYCCCFMWIRWEFLFLNNFLLSTRWTAPFSSTSWLAFSFVFHGVQHRNAHRTISSSSVTFLQDFASAIYFFLFLFHFQLLLFRFL